MKNKEMNKIVYYKKYEYFRESHFDICFVCEEHEAPMQYWWQLYLHIYPFHPLYCKILSLKKDVASELMISLDLWVDGIVLKQVSKIKPRENSTSDDYFSDSNVCQPESHITIWWDYMHCCHSEDEWPIQCSPEDGIPDKIRCSVDKLIEKLKE